MFLAGAALLLAQPAHGLLGGFGGGDDDGDDGLGGALGNLFIGGGDDDGDDALGALDNLFNGGGDDDGEDAFSFDFFADTGAWLDGLLGGIDFTEVSNMIDDAVSDASEGVQGFANAFEDIFSDVNEIPDQFSYFLKDATLDLSQMAADIFSDENIAGLTEDMVGAWDTTADAATNYWDLLGVGAFTDELLKANVDVALFTATAGIGELFRETTENLRLDNLIPNGVDFAKVEKAVAAMDEAGQKKFAASMGAATDVTTGTLDVAKAWLALAEDPTLSAALTAEGVDVAKVKSEASTQLDDASSGASPIAATAAAVGAIVAAMLV